ncbi:MAG: hypothetical protein M3Q71_16260 [Chloroflexota bacterium]|nr:hypothetical protein [Chloroflexota bacterium]
MMVAEPPPNVNDPPPPSDIRRDAEIECRLMSSDALLVWREVLALDLASPDGNYPGPVGRYLASERISAVDAELARREQLASQAPHIVQANTRTHEAWCELARTLRERVDVAELFHTLAGPVTPAGRNGRRGAPEYSAACPACGGDDRLRLWGGPDGRAWCRQCGWSADVVALAQSFAPGCSNFRDAVKWLATIAAAGVA